LRSEFGRFILRADAAFLPARRELVARCRRIPFAA
jgi:hypothetical protein